jgi:hypothetical protein
VHHHLQPRSITVRGELRHRGQPCTVQVNAFAPAFPHHDCSCLLMRSLFSLAHGETRRDVEVSSERTAAIAVAIVLPHVASHLHRFSASTSCTAMLVVSHSCFPGIQFDHYRLISSERRAPRPPCRHGRVRLLLWHLRAGVKAQVWFWKLSDTKVANVM